MKKRFLSILMALSLALSLLPASALAADEATAPTASGVYFFANGTPIEITADQPTGGEPAEFGNGFTATGTAAYISWQDAGTIKYVGVDDSVWVFGGSDGRQQAVSVNRTSINMTGGTIYSLFGGNYGEEGRATDFCSVVEGDVQISLSGTAVVKYLFHGAGARNTRVNGTVTMNFDGVDLSNGKTDALYVNGGSWGNGDEGTRSIETGTMTTDAVASKVVIRATGSKFYLLGGGGSGSTKVLDSDVTLTNCDVSFLFLSGINGEVVDSSISATGCTIESFSATNRGFVGDGYVDLDNCTVAKLNTGAANGCFTSDSGGTDGSGVTGRCVWDLDKNTTVGDAQLTPLVIKNNGSYTNTYENLTVKKAGNRLELKVTDFVADEKNTDTTTQRVYSVPEDSTLTLNGVTATVTNGSTLTNVGTIEMDDSSSLTVPTGATFNQIGEVTGGEVTGEGTINQNYVARIGTTGYTSLTAAITADNSSGGTIDLLTNITNDNVGAAAEDSGGELTLLDVQKNVTINGNGHSITLTVPEDEDTTRNQVINIGKKGETDEVTLTLNGVNLTINGRAYTDGKSVGDAFNMWGNAKLKIENSTLDLDNLSSAFTVQAVGAEVTVDGSTITAENIGGNFSQGGYWTVQNNSSITVDNCVSHGMSVSSLTVSDSTVTVSNAGKRGVSINDANGKLDIQSGSVNVISCVKEESYNSAAVVLGSQATGGLHVAEGATLSVTGTNDRIALNTEAGTTNTLAGKIIGTIQDSSDNPIVAVVEGGGSYTSLSNALSAVGSGKGTVNLVGTDSLSSQLGENVTLVVKSGAALTAVPTCLTGGLEIETGGTLKLNTGEGDPEEFVGGESARLNLTSGSVTMQGTTVTLTANSAATIPSGENFYLMLGSDASTATRLQATVADGATLTINGTLTLPSSPSANKAQLTVNGTVENNGLIRANSGSTVDGSGTVKVNNGGKLTVHTSEANGNATISVTAITLASGGVVYSQFAVADGKIGPSGNVSHSTGSYTLDNVTSGDPPVEVVFTEQYTYYTPSSSSGSSGSTRYTVSVPSDVDNGTVTVSPSRASRGSTVTVTVTPDEGYELDTLTVTDSDGNALTLTDKGDGKYTFTMPRGAVSVAASFKAVEEEPQPSGFPFTDVAENAWYYDAVAYAWENDLMTGTSAATFAPGMTTDRAMLATLLWRLEGEPEVDYLMDFDDVAEGLWYSEAVRWAASEGVVTGVGDGSSFAPTGAITREQMAVMLYRYAQYKDYDVTGSADLSGYADADSVSSWAQYAVAWAVDAGLISGVGNNTLNPQGSATRAEIATILMRFVETFVPAE